MSGDAIAMMVLAMLVIWGGLVVALINLRRSPDLPTQKEVPRDL
ncbi:MAG TPA: methionine/alanine import family NSS transporter small subunit [Marmoricola sp.]|nr:methionine/alanine import family NSS transporter small subunit [Marmoricola sp.]